MKSLSVKQVNITPKAGISALLKCYEQFQHELKLQQCSVHACVDYWHPMTNVHAKSCVSTVQLELM